MAKPRILVLRAPGANCDAETQFAFEQAGGVAERVHINRLREKPSLLASRTRSVLENAAIPEDFPNARSIGEIGAGVLSNYDFTVR